MSQEILNDRKLSRLKMAPQSRIPKPKAAAASSALSSFPLHLQSTELWSEPCTPATANNSVNLDSLLDSALKARMATAAGEEHSWLIGAERGSDVDELLDQFEEEFEDCIDVEGSLPPHDLPSDLDESQGSYDGPLAPSVIEADDHDECIEQEISHHSNGYLQNFVGKLCTMAKTLEWLKAQPFSFTPETPLDRSNLNNNANTSGNDSNNTRSAGGSSCKSSRSLSAAFDLAALEPTAFKFSQQQQQRCVVEAPECLSSSRVSRSRAAEPDLDYYYYYHLGVEEEGDNDDDFLSACSDSELNFNNETHAGIDLAALSPGQASVSSESSGADSDELHRSLLNTSMSLGGVGEWLSNG